MLVTKTVVNEPVVLVIDFGIVEPPPGAHAPNHEHEIPRNAMRVVRQRLEESLANGMPIPYDVPSFVVEDISAENDIDPEKKHLEEIARALSTTSVMREWTTREGLKMTDRRKQMEETSRQMGKKWRRQITQKLLEKKREETTVYPPHITDLLLTDRLSVLLKPVQRP